MKEANLIFAGLAILVNYLHTYWFVDYVSNVKDKFKLFGKWDINPKAVQNYMFCIILSTSIMFLILMGLFNFSVAVLIIEMIINSYYVYCSYEEKYKTQVRQDLEYKLPLAIKEVKVRKRVGAFAFGILVPLCIFIFSYIYHNYEDLQREMADQTEQTSNN